MACTRTIRTDFTLLYFIYFNWLKTLQKLHTRIYSRYKSFLWTDFIMRESNRRQRYRQCTYIVTLSRVRATIVAVKSSKYYILWVRVCSIRYPACNAHEPYCHLLPVKLYNISSTLSHKQTIFIKMLLVAKSVLIFSTRLIWNISHFEKHSARLFIILYQ